MTYSALSKHEMEHGQREEEKRVLFSHETVNLQTRKCQGLNSGHLEIKSPRWDTLLVYKLHAEMLSEGVSREGDGGGGGGRAWSGEGGFGEGCCT